MIHEELLFKLNKNALISARLFGWVTNRKELNALRAIIELHKPSKAWGDTYCGFCFDLSWEPSGLQMDEADFTYPCPTIQAIEKALQ